jgi:3D (Asp-Asp-Asp) domain-containing protein
MSPTSVNRRIFDLLVLNSALAFLHGGLSGYQESTARRPVKKALPGKWQTFTATAYSVEGTTASGKPTVEGRTVAADPTILPKGTRIEVRGAGPYSGAYVVQDTGPAIKGREIDIFIDAPAEAKRFGRKQVKVRVIGEAAAAGQK